jgi:multiple sugar transport system ATP-binding protein
MKPVTIHNVSKQFLSLRGTVNALQRIDLDINAGAFFVLLGPSGCGKSTLLNIIAGIETPTTGEIQIDQKIVVSPQHRIFLTPRERNVAMVFQSYALYPHMNVFDNIAFPLRIAKTSKSKIQSKVQAVAGILEIESLLKAKPSELSGGQRQRVAIGRAIVRHPDILLLDEPLSNLDARLRVTMRSELKQLQRRLQVTTIYVTHDQVEAMNLGDTIAVINEGSIQQVGTPHDIFNRPQNTFVAGFVGTPPMNLLPGTIFNLASRETPVAEELNLSDITLGIRPEHIRISPDAKSALFQATITIVGTLGSETLLHLIVDSHNLVAKCPESRTWKDGDTVGIDFDNDTLHIFDQHGNRIQT